MSTTLHGDAGIAARPAGSSDAEVSATTYGFGMAAAITFVFNTLLAWVKDAWDPLNNFMAALTGHHWITHGLVDVILFLALGYFLSSARNGEEGDGFKLAKTLVATAVLAGAGLGLWFLIV